MIAIGVVLGRRIVFCKGDCQVIAYVLEAAETKDSNNVSNYIWFLVDIEGREHNTTGIIIKEDYEL